jgi:cytochrome oxidase Cu insertion factor (SCO1/SenC/PrrC family)
MLKYISKTNFIHRELLTTLLSFWLVLTPVLALAHEGHEPHTAAPTGAIGGNFALTDQNGKPAKDADYRGKIMLVFFGFTHCPDVCPVTVSTMSKAMGLLGDKTDQVAPIFITVDPARDTPSVLKDYLANFDKHIIGLTGSPEAIKKAADAYKVYFSISEASKQKNGDYSVDHSTIIYMMGKDGAYLRHFSYDTGEAEIAAAIKEALK